jgi:uncharacterized protein YigE (DUF2233 family)
VVSGLRCALIAAGLALLLAACSDPPAAPLLIAPRASMPTPAKIPTQQPTPSPTLTLTPSLTPTPSVTPSPTPYPFDSGWQGIAPGFERRDLKIHLPRAEQDAPLVIVRIDPSRARFRVHYDPEEPHTVGQWGNLTEALVVVNANYFDDEDDPVGVLVVDGEQVNGYYRFPRLIGAKGLFSVSGDEISLTPLYRSSDVPEEMPDYAVQGYPFLVNPGGWPSFPYETDARARRSVIALDNEGRILIMVSDQHLFTLYELSRWLVSSDLGIDAALNLDGGRSSGLVINAPDAYHQIPSYSTVPSVIAVYARPRPTPTPTRTVEPDR